LTRSYNTIVVVALAAKEEGNGFHKAGNYADAITAYKQGLKLAKAADDATDGKTDLIVALHKNIAAGCLKLAKFTDAIDHCTSALDKSGGDVKALFRRAQAYEQRAKIITNPKEQVKDLGDGFADVVKVTKLDPKNKAAQTLARKLMVQLKQETSQQQSTAGISRDVLDRATNAKTDKARKEGAEHVAAFSQTEAGAKEMFQKGAATRLAPLLEDKDHDVVCAVLHAFSNIAKHPTRALQLFSALTAPPNDTKLTALFNSRNVKTVRAAVTLLSMMLEAVTSEGCDKPIFQAAVNKMLGYLIALLPHRSIIAEARDSAIGAVVKNADRLDVARRFVDLGGVSALLIIASCARSPLYNADEAAEEEKTGIDVSPEARMQVSVALSKMWEETKTNKVPKMMGMGNPDPKKFKKKQENYERMQAECVRNINFTSDIATNVPVVYMLTAVIQGVIDLANEILDAPNVMSSIMKMAASDNREAQCAAAEALSHAASDKKRSKEVMANGFATLKGMYGKELPDAIRVRALCGLCKMGSHGANTSNMKSFADGAVINLAKKIRPFVIGEDKSLDSKKWATEGLAFLTLDADVKEMIVGDKKICKVVKALCASGDPTVQFGLANMLVNITNSYDVEEESEEKEAMKKIGKYAGEHIPEPHTLDGEEYLKKRISLLVTKHKMATAMVNLCSTESERAREQISRVLLAMSEDPAHRGIMLAEGAAKVLVKLADNNTDKGKTKAAHCVAKLAITANPNIAFPGQRAAELARPLINLIKMEGRLMQFEGLMALTNLSCESNDLRMRIVREEGVHAIEDLMFDEDWLVRRAATECMTNMLNCDKVYEMFAHPPDAKDAGKKKVKKEKKDGKKGTEVAGKKAKAVIKGMCWARLKLWILLSGCAHEDYETARAASGGLAILSDSEDVCNRVLEEKQGMKILRENTVCGDLELQRRALYIQANMCRHSDKLAKAVADGHGINMIGALHEVGKHPPVVAICKQILEILEDRGVIEDVNSAIATARAKAHETMAELARPDSESEEEEELPPVDPNFAKTAAWPGKKPYVMEEAEETPERIAAKKAIAERIAASRVKPDEMLTPEQLKAMALADQEHEVEQAGGGGGGGMAMPADGDVEFAEKKTVPGCPNSTNPHHTCSEYCEKLVIEDIAAKAKAANGGGGGVGN